MWRGERKEGGREKEGERERERPQFQTRTRPDNRRDRPSAVHVPHVMFMCRSFYIMFAAI